MLKHLYEFNKGKLHFILLLHMLSILLSMALKTVWNDSASLAIGFVFISVE